MLIPRCSARRQGRRSLQASPEHGREESSGGGATQGRKAAEEVPHREGSSSCGVIDTARATGEVIKSKTDVTSSVELASGPHLVTRTETKDSIPKHLSASIGDEGLAVAAEVIRGGEDLEAQVQARVHQERHEIVSEVQKQIMEQAKPAELVVIEKSDDNATSCCSRRRKWIALMGLLATIAIVVSLVVILLPSDSDSDPDPDPDPDADPDPDPIISSCTLCEDGFAPEDLDALILGEGGVTFTDFNETLGQFIATSEACLQGQAQAWRCCGCPTLPNLPSVHATCAICMNGSIPLETPHLLVDNKSCSEWNVYMAHTPSDSPKCNALRADLWDVIDQCTCIEDKTFLQYISHELFPLSGDALLEDGTPQNTALNWLAAEDPASLSIETTVKEIQERYALAVLYYATEGTAWDDDYSFLSSENVCMWNDGSSGVFCAGNVVERISLYSNSLHGKLPLEISVLSQLKSIAIWSNDLIGTIPEAFGGLTKLETFDVDFNSMTGSLPASLLGIQSLQSVLLAENQFSGSLPSVFGKSLSDLTFTGNRLNGKLPQSIGDLSSLWYLDLSSNDFSGPLPSEIGNLLELYSLDLDGNSFSGTIPPSVGTLPWLSYVSLAGNDLTGEIPPFISEHLDAVSLAENQLDGTLESFFTSTNPASLRLINFSANKLSGSLPEAIGSFLQLEELNLDKNLFTGAIPSTLGNLENAGLVWLNDAGFTGSIPTELGHLGKLSSLDLAQNDFTGSFPSVVANLQNLETLYIHGNAFTNDFEETFCMRGNLIDTLSSNCLDDAVDCSCCSYCCDALGNNCV